MKISELQSKIASLELCIEDDIRTIVQEKKFLVEKIKSVKTLLYVSQILVAGFSFGYMLAPRNKKQSNMKRSMSITLFLMLRKVFKSVPSLFSQATSTLSKLTA